MRIRNLEVVANTAVQIWRVVQLTVGMIDIEDKIKEALTNTRVHPETGESLPAGGASFSLYIPQLISTFNSEEGIILKNLPDGLLYHNDFQ